LDLGVDISTCKGKFEEEYRPVYVELSFCHVIFTLVLPTLYNTDLVIVLAAMAVDVGMTSCGFAS